MPEFKSFGLDELMLSLEEISAIPEEVQDEILNAQAKITMEAQREEAQKLGMYSGYNTSNNERHTTSTNQLPGQEKSYSTGALARSIRIRKPKAVKGNRKISIYFAGSRKRGNTVTKNTEIAFLNEYGTRTINQRNFIRVANEKSAQKATMAALEVYDKFLKSKNL